MTTIAWDGEMLAADGQGQTAGHMVQVVKAWARDASTHSRLIYAATGNIAVGLELKRWHEAGADPDKFRRTTDSDEFARLIVIDADPGGPDWLMPGRRARVRVYEGFPDPLELVDGHPHAWGSGADFAIAAMHLGRTAEQAVNVAHRFDPATGPCTTIHRLWS